MLKNYCNVLSDEAQVSISIRLIKIILPVWKHYYLDNPDDLNKVNASITPDNRVQGGAGKIDITLPEKTISDIEKAISSGKNLNRSFKLRKHLATYIEPLTIETWDKLLPDSIRLVFTSIFNLLSFLIHERFTPDNETHIYVSINMACDVILRENIMDKSELELLLLEYKDYKAFRN